MELNTNYQGWTVGDYVRNYLSISAARSRLSGNHFPIDSLSEREIERLCAPIRRAIESRYVRENADISIILRAFNEEKELLPTLISYAFCCELPAPTELIVVDNNSDDRTAFIAECCGVKRVTCKQPGIGYATKKGYDSISGTSRYVLISDADVRPSRPVEGELKMATFINTSFAYLERHKRAMGVSTGTELEAAHWSYWVLNRMSKMFGFRRRSVNYWGGANQFIRRHALDAIGGIDPEVEYGCSEDHARRFALARWCKPRGFELPEGSFDCDLIDPNFHSGRRHGTFGRVVSHHCYMLARKTPEIGADGWPVFVRRASTGKKMIR